MERQAAQDSLGNLNQQFVIISAIFHGCNMVAASITHIADTVAANMLQVSPFLSLLVRQDEIKLAVLTFCIL